MSTTMLTRLLSVAANPATLLQHGLRRLPGLAVETKVALDLYPRPAYAYAVFYAAQQARMLGIPAITLIEFGVAKGDGLLALEQIAADVRRETGVRFQIYGFDLGEGLPAPRDYRDLPYVYRAGFYRMDRESLEPRLRKSKLVLGDVAQTVPAFVRAGGFPPIGFIALDVDYYSSTVSVFEIFSGTDAQYLPRMFCYFDDVGLAPALHCEYTGELLAIREFNEQHAHTKICPINGLWLTRVIRSPWNNQLYVCHQFDHPRYNIFATPEAEAHTQ